MHAPTVWVYALCALVCTVSAAAIPGSSNFCMKPGLVPACSQQCTTTATGYQCHCVQGYTLLGDDRSCMPQGNEEPALIFADQGALKTHMLESDYPQTMLVPVGNVNKIAVGANNTLYWTDRVNNAVYMSRFDSDFRAAEPQLVVDTGLKSPNGIAVDWLTGNLYIVETSLGAIVICTAKGDNCVPLVTGLQQPQDIVLDVEKRILLWTEWGEGDNAGLVGHAQMDGSGTKIFIMGLNKPTSLVLDPTIPALYWLVEMDGRTAVQMMELSGAHKRVVYSFDGRRPQDLAVFTDYLYLVDAEQGEIIHMNKFTGHEMSVLQNVSQPSGLVAWHPVLHMLQQPGNPCGRSPCSHLCIPSFQGYSCACPVDMILVSPTTCKNRDVPRLIASGEEGIFEVPIEYTGLSNLRGRLLLAVDADIVRYCPLDHRVIFHDVLARSIRSLNLGVQQPVAVTLYHDHAYVEDMALDLVAKNLYWTSYEGTVHVGRLDGSFSVTLIKAGLEKPRGLALDPATGYMYIADWGTNPRIIKCHMDGTDCVQFLDLQGVPNFVVIDDQSAPDRKLLYWTNSQQETIGIVDLNDEKREIMEIPLNTVDNPHPFSLAVAEGHIYYSDLNTRHIHHLMRTNQTIIHDLALHHGSLYGLSLAGTGLYLQDVHNACSHNNGGCSHMCLIKPGGQSTCRCPPEWMMGPNQQTCYTNEIPSEITDLMPKIELFTGQVAPQTPDPIDLVFVAQPSLPPLPENPHSEPVQHANSLLPTPNEATPKATDDIVDQPYIIPSLKPGYILPDDVEIETAAHITSTDEIDRSTTEAIALLDNRRITEDSADEKVWIAGVLLAALVIVALVILGVCYFKKYRGREQWFSKLIHYHKSPKDELEELVPSLTVSNANFETCEEIDLRQHKESGKKRKDKNSANSRQNTYQKMSRVSTDSAFIEIATDSNSNSSMSTMDENIYEN